MSLAPSDRSRVEVPCTIDISHRAEALHAHVELEGIDIQPGDAVLIREAPTELSFGDQMVFSRHATVVRAGLLKRMWTRLCGHFDLGALYEVGFSSDRINVPNRRRT